jgi:hypothetical protein
MEGAMLALVEAAIKRAGERFRRARGAGTHASLDSKEAASV